MDIRVLQYFLAVAREGSITKAAVTLHMTQPPLSRQLKELEDELGKRLLIRGGKKVTLTEEGELLKKRAEEMVGLMEKTRAELNGSDGNISGDIYIGSGETDAVSYFAQAAANLQKRYPMIRYHIYSGDAEWVTERLDKGLIDFGLLVGPADMDRYDGIRLPVSDTWGMLMRRDDPLAGKDSVTAEDIKDRPLLISHQASADSAMLSRLRVEGSKLNVALSYNLIYNAAHFVEKGLGLAIALDKLVNTAGESRLCFRPLRPTMRSELSIVWKKHQVFSRASSAFLHELQAELGINV